MTEATGMPRRGFGVVLTIAGMVGLVAGLVPLIVNGARMLTRADPFRALVQRAGEAGHGVEEMGLHLDWAVLSCALGTYLGALLLIAGIGWIRGRRWASSVTWAYVGCGLTVNITDMFIFYYQARVGPMRSRMLLLDGIALAFAVLVFVWLFGIRRGQKQGREAAALT
ncbi:MAG: hypothetical protein ACOC8E_07100 [Planctomycetota bacterium]